MFETLALEDSPHSTPPWALVGRSTTPARAIPWLARRFPERMHQQTLVSLVHQRKHDRKRLHVCDVRTAGLEETGATRLLRFVKCQLSASCRRLHLSQFALPLLHLSRLALPKKR
jgi:hypothetical protein